MSASMAHKYGALRFRHIFLVLPKHSDPPRDSIGVWVRVRVECLVSVRRVSGLLYSAFEAGELRVLAPLDVHEYAFGGESCATRLV